MVDERRWISNLPLFTCLPPSLPLLGFLASYWYSNIMIGSLSCRSTSSVNCSRKEKEVMDPINQNMVAGNPGDIVISKAGAAIVIGGSLAVGAILPLAYKKLAQMTGFDPLGGAVRGIKRLFGAGETVIVQVPAQQLPAQAAPPIQVPAQAVEVQTAPQAQKVVPQPPPPTVHKIVELPAPTPELVPVPA